MSAVSIPTPTTWASKRTMAFGPFAPDYSSRSLRAASICWICSVTTCRRAMSRCNSARVFGGRAVPSGVRKASRCSRALRTVGLKPRTPRPRQGGFDPVHNPGALAHQAFALAGGALGILVRKGRNGGHVTMLRLAPQPAEEHALEQGGVEPRSVLARRCSRETATLVG